MIRGKILRDTNSGPGVVIVDGVQKTFTLENHWRSDNPPKVGGVVNVELNESGEVTAVHAVDDAVIAKEQAQKALDLASEQGKKWAALAGTHGKSFGGAFVAKVGMPTLVAVGLLALGWFILSTLNLQLSRASQESITLYEALKLLNGNFDLSDARYLDRRSTGFIGVVMWLALLAPLASHFHPHKLLKLGYCAPLAFMLYVAGSVYFGIRSSVSEMTATAAQYGGARAAAMAEQMASEMLRMTYDAISIGAGAYLALIVAVYLAAVGIKKFLVATA